VVGFEILDSHLYLLDAMKVFVQQALGREIRTIRNSAGKVSC